MAVADAKKVTLCDTAFVDVTTSYEVIIAGACDDAISQHLREFLKLCVGDVEFPLRRTESYKFKKDNTRTVTAELRMVRASSETEPDFWINVTVDDCPHKSKCMASYQLLTQNNNTSSQYNIPDDFYDDITDGHYDESDFDALMDHVNSLA